MTTFIFVFFPDQFTLDYFILALLAFTSIPSFIAINLNSARGYLTCSINSSSGNWWLFVALNILTNDNSTLTEVLLLYALTSVITSIFILIMNWIHELTFGKEQSSYVRAIGISANSLLYSIGNQSFN